MYTWLELQLANDWRNSYVFIMEHRTQKSRMSATKVWLIYNLINFEYFICFFVLSVYQEYLVPHVYLPYYECYMSSFSHLYFQQTQDILTLSVLNVS